MEFELTSKIYIIEGEFRALQIGDRALKSGGAAFVSCLAIDQCVTLNLLLKLQVPRKTNNRDNYGTGLLELLFIK